MFLQILSAAGPSGEKKSRMRRGRTPRGSPMRSSFPTPRPSTGRPLPPRPPSRQGIRARLRWTASPAGARRSTEVPAVGLTHRSTPPPHSSSTLHRAPPPPPFFLSAHYLQRDSLISAKEALSCVYIPSLPSPHTSAFSTVQMDQGF